MTAKPAKRHAAEMLGVFAFAAAVAVFPVSPFLTMGVLALFIGICLAACFFPQMNLLGPIIYRGNTGRPCVALTFDDGPSEPLTAEVLDLLERYNAPATFFVSGVNALAHPDLIARIAARGHLLGNHSYNHSPFLMLKTRRRLLFEITEAQAALESLGIKTHVFRPPVGIINPKLPPLLDMLNLSLVTFSCRAGDAGNRRIQHLSRKILKNVKPDDIILLHDVCPPRACHPKAFLAEMDNILSGLRDKGLAIVPLDELIGRPVMSVLR